MGFDDSVEEMTRPRANCIIFYKRVLNILKYGKKEKERERKGEKLYGILLRFVVASVVIVIIFGNIRYV